MDREWEALAAWYDARQGDTGDLWHRALIDPGLLAVLGPVRGLELLDLACGNGYLSRRFAREGARVTGVDASAPIVRLARARERRAPLGVRYLVADAARLDALADGRFDIVVSNMALMDIRGADRAIAEVGRLLRPSGRFVFSICHPCFDVMSRSAWEIERGFRSEVVWRKVQRYREPYEELCPWKVGEKEYRAVPGFHRPLAWYVRALRAAGLVIEAFEEPAPGPEMFPGSPQAPYLAEVPLHCVIGARRTGGPGATDAGPARVGPRAARRARGTAPR